MLKRCQRMGCNNPTNPRSRVWCSGDCRERSRVRGNPPAPKPAPAPRVRITADIREAAAWLRVSPADLAIRGDWSGLEADDIIAKWREMERLTA